MKRSVVFVYGTLKSGFSNHHHLESSEYLGTGKTVEKYSLYISGIPYVIRHEPVSSIQGEIYLVDDQTLSRLDQLEGHPEWYRRQDVEILTENDDKIVCWLYFYPEKKGKLEISGCYSSR